MRRATDIERTAVRGWFMRGTLQLVPAADARWLLALFGPVYLALAARRLRELRPRCIPVHAFRAAHHRSDRR
ncbi:hypothetical protein SAVIM40S_06999 [Streptomyces avidinii]